MAGNSTSSFANNQSYHYIFAVVLIIIGVVSLVLNIVFSVTFCRVRRFRKPPNWFLMNLMFCDYIALAGWLGPSVYAALVWEWKLGSIYCDIQPVISSLCYYVNIHMFAVIAMEKCVKFCYPSRHKLTFFNTSVMVVILSVWLFDLVIALFPIFGWGELGFLPQILQCHFFYEKSISQQSFVFLVTFIIPVVATAVFFLIGYCKIRKTRMRIGETGKVILEENNEVPKASFAEQLRKQNARFILDPAAVKKQKGEEETKREKKLKKKMKKKDIKKKMEKSGSDAWSNKTNVHSSSNSSSGSNENNSSSSSSSDDEANKIKTPQVKEKGPVVYNVNYDYLGLKQQKSEQKAKHKRVYKLKKQAAKMAVTNFISWVVYILLWLPFLVVSYIWTFHPNATGEEIHVTVAFLTFMTLASKPFVYLFNSWMRSCIKDAFCGAKKEDFLLPSAADDKTAY